MAARDPVEQLEVAGVRPLGEARAFEELVGDALKCRHHADDRLAAPGIEQNPADVADRGGRGKRRAAELEDFHRARKDISLDTVSNGS